MFNYLDVDSLIEFHDYIIDEFWGLKWTKNIWQLESILSHIQNDEYYSTFSEKITHLFFSMVQFHVFNDGNKRTSILAVELFLFINDIYIEDVIIKLEDIAIWIAKWNISKDNLGNIFDAMFISFWYDHLCFQHN